MRTVTVRRVRRSMNSIPARTILIVAVDNGSSCFYNRDKCDYGDNHLG
jgi:hypothetical protein